MTTMTQLFKIVSTNDYDTLEKLIASTKKPDFNCIKSGISLVHKAIEVRALECFNLLMTLPDLSVIQSNNSSVNGLSIALEYYSQAPNQSNKHYLDKLIERNVSIDSYSLSKCMEDQVLFDSMFNRVDKNGTTILNLITCAVNRTNVSAMNKLYDWLYANNPAFYSTQETKNTFNDNILRTAIASNNIIAIEHLEKIGHNILTLKYQNNQTPSLYYANYSNTESIAFNFIFSRTEKMDAESLNQIPGIMKLSGFIKNSSYYHTNKNGNENLKKILSLPVNWDDLADSIADVYKNIYQDLSSYYWNQKKNKDKINQRLNLMYMIIKTNKIKSNPFDKIATFKSELTSIINIAIKRSGTNQVQVNEQKLIARQCKYILIASGFKEPAGLAEHFKLVFTDDVSTYETEYANYIAELESFAKGVEETKKPKARVIKKKKPVPTEIDV